MCDHGFECARRAATARSDGDGTCEEKADYAYEGENMCDWWKWAYRYGPNKTETGPYATNWKTGHAYAEDGSLPKKWYSINGKNCSKWDVDVVSTDKCKGLFHYCNATHCDEYRVGPQKPEARPRGHDLLLGLPRAGFCGRPFLRGRPVALRALRVEGACGKGACVQASLGLSSGAPPPTRRPRS